MSIFILIAAAAIVYLILGTIFGIVVTLLRTNNLRLKIVLLLFLRAATYTLLLWIFLPGWSGTHWISIGVFILLVIMKDVAFGNHKFLLNVEIHDDNIHIHYINLFLQKKAIILSGENVTKVRLSNMKSFLEYPGSLNIRDGNDEQKFIIIDKKICGLTRAALSPAKPIAL